MRKSPVLAVMVACLSASSAFGQDATPRDATTDDAVECSEAAGILADEPPGFGRPLMERLFALDGCAAILAREQGATAAGIHAEATCTAGGEEHDWPRRAYVFGRTCAEGATERVWGSTADRTPGTSGPTATVRP